MSANVWLLFFVCLAICRTTTATKSSHSPSLRISAAWHSFSFASMELHRIICTKHYHTIEHQMVLHVRVCNVCSGNKQKRRENEEKCFRFVRFSFGIIFACRMRDYDGAICVYKRMHHMRKSSLFCSIKSECVVQSFSRDSIQFSEHGFSFCSPVDPIEMG